VVVKIFMKQSKVLSRGHDSQGADATVLRIDALPIQDILLKPLATIKLSVEKRSNVDREEIAILQSNIETVTDGLTGSDLGRDKGMVEITSETGLVLAIHDEDTDGILTINSEEEI
jgi:hypothetical protein